MTPKTQTEAYRYSPEREDRVAAALRENLRKRKMQQQTQAASSSDTTVKE